MIVEKWTYENKTLHAVEEDKFYDDKYLHRKVDLGWDYYFSSVHYWIRKLNRFAYIHNVLRDEVRMNSITFKRLKIETHQSYDISVGWFVDEYTKKPIGKFKLDNSLKENNVFIYFENKLVGKIEIDYGKFF